MAEKTTLMLIGPEICNGKVLFYGHVWCCTHERILEKASDVAASHMLLLEGDVLSVKLYETRIGVKGAGDGIE